MRSNGIFVMGSDGKNLETFEIKTAAYESNPEDVSALIRTAEMSTLAGSSQTLTDSQKRCYFPTSMLPV